MQRSGLSLLERGAYVAEKLVTQPHRDGFEIVGNREGLNGLAEICLQLADLPEDDAEATRLGNHYHFADYMNNLEEGSIPVVIHYKPDL
jgi:hypothetical protein